MFICSKCGACCQQLELFGPMYDHLDKGNGVCIYFDQSTKLCTIYEHRPLICRVEEGYNVYFSNISYCEYIKNTENACKKLQTSMRNKMCEKAL